IRLNEESELTVPDKMKGNRRSVTLNGEAYFDVARDPDHPFVVYANGSTVTVLGTEFNVKADSTAGNVQVAVVEGKVSLKKEGAKESASALLTRNNFGLLDLEDRKSTRLNSSHVSISYAVFCLKKKKQTRDRDKETSATQTVQHGYDE